MHVRDLDPLDGAHCGAERERRVRVVRVDVRLQRTRVADDHQRVAEPFELALERGLVEVVSLDDERRAVAEARLRLVDRLRRELLLGRLGRQLLARQRGGDPPDQLDQARAARVDHARLAQDVELLGRACDRLLPAPDNGCEKLREGRVLPRGSLGGKLAGDGQDRSFDGLAHGRIGSVARGCESARDRLGIDLAGLRKRLGRATDDLREDHARVAARAEQRRPRRLTRELGPVARLGARQGFRHSASRQQQVRPRVAVGDRIDVEVVDPPPAALEARAGRVDQGS